MYPCLLSFKVTFLTGPSISPGLSIKIPPFLSHNAAGKFFVVLTWREKRKRDRVLEGSFSIAITLQYRTRCLIQNLYFQLIT
jgi:hypothetical protein